MNFKGFKDKFEKKEVEHYTHRGNDEIMVSISIVTFQHKNYIKQCLDGILMQETDFSFEILLGEDGSTDGTREICKEYARKYPEKIRLFLHHRENNIKINGQPTGRFNFLYNMFAARGKYIALCEGDDYWTDPLKLQKQVDFLEANEDYGICFHNVEQLNSFTNERFLIPGNYQDMNYSFEDYILQNRTATCSILFRKKYLPEIPIWFYKSPFGDLALILLIMNESNQRGYVFKEAMAVYRIHSGGLHGKFQQNEEGLIQAYKEHLQFVDLISSQFLDSRYKIVLFQKKYNTYKILAKLYWKTNQPFYYFKTLILNSLYQFLKKIKD